MKSNLLSSLSLPLLVIILLNYIATESQALSLATAGDRNITAILEKAGPFSNLIRLLKATQMDDRINTQLNKSNQGLTIFAPSDDGFSGLATGTLNSLTYQQQVQLAQFHVLTSYISSTQFQTATNPLHTEAGDSTDGQFPLNITTSNGQVNLTSGVVNATVGNSVYTDGHLAVYQVDHVLLPQQIFAVAAPAPAPAPVPALAPAPSKSNPSVEASGAVPLGWNSIIWFGGALLAAFSMW
ncbi:fasciclin-like arabinogalactan protein 12 [Malania oleifera]|uniref:fasciclin-like arabinogalactan protein 12 n=1 Tax=Malania oleifera TaxID=397392 RepID=UPI0025AEB0C3|nr:fasciclin-like arabinogalactan protein 12 [Malania oleifera]